MWLIIKKVGDGFEKVAQFTKNASYTIQIFGWPAQVLRKLKQRRKFFRKIQYPVKFESLLSLLSNLKTKLPRSYIQLQLQLFESVIEIEILRNMKQKCFIFKKLKMP